MSDIDQTKIDKFVNKLLEVINAGGLNLMLSIGHRTGLFDSMAEMDPSTSEQIAKKSGLNERYVREWLGAMVSGQVINYNPCDMTYSLPAEHAALLTRAASPDNIAVTTQWIPVLAYVEDEVVECFKKGGGVPYSSFNRFHEVMAEESAQTVVATLITHILPLASGAVESLNNGIDVLDIGCGSGRAINKMAKEFINSNFIGYDISDEAISAARVEANKLGLSNVNFEVKDVSNIGELNRFDLITAFDAIHDQANPNKVLGEIANALKSHGTFLMQDIKTSSHVEKNIANPIGAFLYAISTMHCMTVSLAQGGAGLGACWGEELALKMLEDAGFKNVEVKLLEHDFINSYFISKK